MVGTVHTEKPWGPFCKHWLTFIPKWILLCMCEHVSILWQQDKTSREPRTTESQTYLFATQSYVQRDNHSAMTHPLKLDWHQSQDPNTLHTAKVGYFTNGLLGCLQLTLAYRYHSYGRDMRTCLFALATGLMPPMSDLLHDMSRSPAANLWPLRYRSSMEECTKMWSAKWHKLPKPQITKIKFAPGSLSFI